MPSLRVGSITATVSCSVLILTSSNRLQSVLNSAARLVLNISKFSNISAAIRDELHWLPIRRRIDFKIALMVRHCMVGTATEYRIWWSCAIQFALPSVVNVSGQLLVGTSLFRGFVSRHSVIGPLLFQAPVFGTHSRSRLDSRVTIFCSSKRNWKRIYSSSSERCCGYISNEGPYKSSILLLLLLQLEPHYDKLALPLRAIVEIMFWK